MVHGSASTRVFFVACVALCLMLMSCGGNTAPVDPDPLDYNQTKTVLRISPFGEGSVAVNGAVATCLESLCESTVATNTNVSLVATPAAGWVFDHWSGCDAVAATNCTVKATPERLVQPFFKTPDAPELQKDVVVLNDDSMLGFLGESNGKYTFSSTVTQIAMLQSDEVIVSVKDKGFARRVLEKTVLPNGDFVLDTVSVTLPEIVGQGVLISNPNAVPKGRVVALGLSEGVSLRTSELQPAATTKLDIKVKLSEKVSITGTLDIDWNPEAALRLSWLHGVEEVKLIINPLVVPKIKVTYSGFEEKKDAEFELGIFALPPIVAGPVVINPTVKGYVRYDIKGQISIDLDTSYSIQGSYGIHYKRKMGWKGVMSTEASGNFNLTDTIKISMLAGVGTVANFAIYDIAGPFVKVGPYVKLEINAKLSSGADCSLEVRTDLGLRADAGGRIDVFGLFKAEFKFILFDKIIKNLYKSPKPSCTDSKSPESPNAVTARPVTDGVLLEWSDGGDNIKTTSYEIYRDGVLATKQSELGFTDTQVLANTTYCYKVVALDAQDNRSLPSANACLKTPKRFVPDLEIAPQGLSVAATSTSTVDVSWQAITAFGDGLDYVVQVDGRSLKYTNDTKLEIGQLRPGTRYCFRVKAEDPYGNASAWSNEICVVTLGARNIQWVDWESGSANQASGKISTRYANLTVTASGPHGFVQTNAGVNYWTNSRTPLSTFTGPAVLNAPGTSDIIGLADGGTETITFSAPVIDPVVALVSWNNNTVKFNQPIEILSNGPGYFGGGQMVLNSTGDGFYGSGEVHGVVRIKGTVSSFSFSHSNEDWHGFTLGVAATAAR